MALIQLYLDTIVPGRVMSFPSLYFAFCPSLFAPASVSTRFSVMPSFTISSMMLVPSVVFIMLILSVVPIVSIMFVTLIVFVILVVFVLFVLLMLVMVPLLLIVPIRRAVVMFVPGLVTSAALSMSIPAALSPLLKPYVMPPLPV